MAKKYSDREKESYVRGQMPAKDRKRLEADMAQDKGLAQEIDTYRAEAALYQIMEEEDLLNQLSDWDQEKEKKGNSSGSKWWKYGLGLLVLGIAALVVIKLDLIPGSPVEDIPSETQAVPTTDEDDTLQEETESIQETETDGTNSETEDSPVASTIDYDAEALDFYNNAPFRVQLRSNANAQTPDSRYQQALAAFEDENYTRSLQLLDPLDTARLQAFLFLRAHTYYQLDRLPEAQADFAAFRNFSVSLLKQDAIWGEALSLLRQMPATEERLLPLLDTLRSTANPYRAQADSLLQVLQVGNRK